MIPRYQLVLLSLLLGASVAMGAVLWHLRDRAHQRLLAGEVSTPTQAPQVAPVEQATLLVANDEDGTLQPRVLTLPLPSSSGERARAVLGKLLDLYAAEGSTHPLTGGAGAIAQVFLLPEGKLSTSSMKQATVTEPQNGPELAVVNLTGTFVSNHPAGIQTETLTLLSICATLHANLPRIGEVRFLVDGQPRETLAGHADLTRTYLTGDSGPAAIATPAGLTQ
jgi:Sporulation and spore germination